MKKADIQRMQDLYNEWMVLQPELEKGLEQWRKSIQIIESLKDFYAGDEWQQLHESFNEPLDTKGNYSILSEDTLWNAFSEQYQLAIEHLRLATKIIAGK